MQRIALIGLIITLFFSNFSNSVYAANDYNHSELMEYSGYGEAMYESIVEQTTYVTGQYTDNKEYVSQTIDEIKSYAEFWKNDFNNWDKSCNNDFTGCMSGMLEGAGGLVLTVGDFIKQLFTDYREESGDENVIPDYSGLLGFNGTHLYTLDEKQQICAQPRINGDEYCYRFLGVGMDKQWSSSAYRYYANFGQSSSIYTDYYFADSEPHAFELLEKFNGLSGTLSGEMMKLSESKISWYIKEVETDELVPLPLPSTNGFSRFKDYIDNNDIQIPMPQLAPTLVCPGGTTIKMGISGSTFIAVNGETMLVNKDGTAEVNGEICNLNWEKPTVKYDPDGNVVTTQPDGTTDTTDKVPDFKDLEGCDGVVFCAIAKLLDGLGSVVKAIMDLVGKILDGLLSLFVPDDLSFLTTEFTRITDKLTEKIGIVEDLKKMITGIFSEGETNPLQDITLDLPILDKPVQFGDMSLINEGVPILKKVISAICILYTLIYVYRKITGRGGVMEK